MDVIKLFPFVKIGRRLGLGKVKYQFSNWLKTLQLSWYHRHQSSLEKDLSFTDMVKAFPHRNEMYAYAVYYYAHNLPIELKDHRNYFKKNKRGFGEDSFHALWWLLLREYKPQRCLEIGVYRGQDISLWALIAKALKFPCEVHGISPFTQVGDAVSTYLDDVDYLDDTLQSFKLFDLPDPTLVRALSTDPQAVSHIISRTWDLIYIDGSHDYEVVLADYQLCRDHLSPGGLLAMDDSSLDTTFNAPLFSFAGHPGPSRVMNEDAMSEMKFIGAVGHINIFQKK